MEHNYEDFQLFPHTVWGLLLRWPTSEPANYELKMIRPRQPHTFKGVFSNFSTLLLYSFDHHDDLEKESMPKVDISDIDGLSDIPIVPGDDSSVWLPDLSVDGDDADLIPSPTG